MDYRLARQSSARFLAEYDHYDRWVIEQNLDLSINERNELFKFLEINNLPENQVYSYDFFYDNCATKMWDVLQATFGKKIVFDEAYLANQYTFRQLIHQNLQTNSWSAFGIDLALGSVIDNVATPKEHMYLPQYTMEQLRTSKKGDALLVTNEEILFKSKPQERANAFLTSPLFWLLVTMLVVVLVTYMDFKKNRRSRWLDFTIFLITGLAGLLLLFLWFLTDHSQTILNFNVLWVFPFNAIVAFILVKHSTPPQWLKKYLWVLLALILIIPLIWIFKIQIFSPLIIFILVALVIRYLFLLNMLSHSRNPTIKS
jgi:hypothetical protein